MRLLGIFEKLSSDGERFPRDQFIGILSENFFLFQKGYQNSNPASDFQPKIKQENKKKCA